MVINTNFNNTTGAAGTRSQRAQSAENAADSTQQNTNSKDSGEMVNLSSEAQILAQLEAQVKQAPDVDAERVASIKAAIDSGTYQFDAERVAQRMLDSDSQL